MSQAGMQGFKALESPPSLRLYLIGIIALFGFSLQTLPELLVVLSQLVPDPDTKGSFRQLECSHAPTVPRGVNPLGAAVEPTFRCATFASARLLGLALISSGQL